MRMMSDPMGYIFPRTADDNVQRSIDFMRESAEWWDGPEGQAEIAAASKRDAEVLKGNANHFRAIADNIERRNNA